MILPPETLNCFDIPPVRAGLVKLRPLTLGDVATLARAGIDVCDVSDLGAAEAIFALLAHHYSPSLHGAMRRNPFRPPPFMRLRSTARQRADAVSRALEIAFRNSVPGKNADTEVVSETGYGWPLEIAERLMHEYSLTFREATETPLAIAFALLAVARVRNGGKAGGPDYWTRATLAAAFASGALRR